MINFLFYKYCFEQTKDGNLFSGENHEKVTPEYINAGLAEHLETVVTKGTKSLNLLGIKSDRKKEEAPESYKPITAGGDNGLIVC